MIDTEEGIELRQNWLSVLAKSDATLLQELWLSHSFKKECEIVRSPETGLVMVRGRAGGTGNPFNLGEATVTRCSVRSSSGEMGHAYILGRNANHAHQAAEVDLALQDPNLRDDILSQIIEPLRQNYEQLKTQQSKKVAATKVDFFTMVRGED